MAGRRFTADERAWLEYLSDIGYTDLRLDLSPGDEGEPQAQRERSVVPETKPVVGPGAGGGKLDVVREKALQCTACGLSATRKTVVFGSGDPDADLMFIGEGPGAEEDRQGLPFVGPAGSLLTQIIQAIGLTREEVYIANVVKCRPPRNRDPEPAEVAACSDFLRSQIEHVRPRVIVALGRVAAQSLLGLSSPLGRMRGSWHSVHGVPTRVTYHPAALLRNASYKRPTWEDMQIVRDRLAEAS